MVDQEKTTHKVWSTIKTDLQEARNRFAVAYKNFVENPTDETQVEWEASQVELTRIEDEYREGRRLLLEYVSKQTEKRQ